VRDPDYLSGEGEGTSKPKKEAHLGNTFLARNAILSGQNQPRHNQKD